MLLESVIIHRTSHPVRLSNVLRRLCQVAAQHLQVGVSHQLLQVEYICIHPRHVVTDSTPKKVQAWSNCIGLNCTTKNC